MACITLDLVKKIILSVSMFITGPAYAVTTWETQVELSVNGKITMKDTVSCLENELNAVISPLGMKRHPYFVEFSLKKDNESKKIRVSAHLGTFEKKSRKIFAKPSILLKEDEEGFVNAVDLSNGKKIKVKFVVHLRTT